MRAYVLVPAIAATAWLALWTRHMLASDYFVLATFIQDDSYYYLLPAWNFSRLGWFTFDGLTRTYGFQPLWELALAVIARFANTREVFLRLALVASAVCFALTAVQTGRSARELWRRVTGSGGTVAAVTAAGLLLLNMPVVWSNLTAKENALYGLVLATLLLVRQRYASLTQRAALVAGMLAGLSLLARLSPMSLAVVCMQPLPREPEPRRWFVLAYAGAAVVTVMPWVVYATWVFGSPVPTSGRLKLVGFWSGAEMDIAVRTVPLYLVTCVRFALGFPSGFSAVAMGAGLWPGVVFAALVGAGLLWAARVRAISLLLLVGAVFAALAAMPLLLHTKIAEIYYFRWYVVELPILAALLAGLGGEMFAARLRETSRATAVVFSVVLALVMGRAALDVFESSKPVTTYTDEGAWQQVALRLTLWSNEALRLTPADRVGSFSAGIVGWFSSGTVINLDGLANDELAKYWLAGWSFERYCGYRQVRVYIDASNPAECFGPRAVVVKTFSNRSEEYPTYYVARAGAS